MRHLETLLLELYPLSDSTLRDLVGRFERVVEEGRAARSPALKTWDAARGGNTQWVADPSHVVYVAYADLLAQGLPGEGSPLGLLPERLGYLHELGVTDLHLLPIMKTSGDAGFAVDDYTTVDPRFGTNEEFASLVAAAHERGMALTLDLVLNHTSDSHEWARRARAGEATYRAFYVEDESGTGDHWPQVPDVFPDFAPGHWDWVPELGVYLWSTFYSRQPRADGPVLNDFAQWDLDYRNPEVLLAMCETMVRVANMGVDCMRLDAAPFLWKEKGTRCTSLPQLHTLMRIFRHVLDQVAPSTALLAEANDVLERLVPYFGTAGFAGHECQLAYAFPFMPFLWHAVAFGEPGPLGRVLRAAPPTPPGCAWLVFDEVHDEVSLEIVEDVFPGEEGEDMCRRIFRHYTQEGRGVPFRFDPQHEEYGHGFSGTRWTLLGGEVADRAGDEAARARILEEIVLMEAVKLTLPGVPLVYSGQELAQGSDWSFREDPGRAPDTRFLKRVALDEEAVGQRGDMAVAAGHVYQATRRLLEARAEEPAFAGDGAIEVLAATPEGMLVLRRPDPSGDVVAAFHFGAEPRPVGVDPGHGRYRDLLGGRAVAGDLQGEVLEPRSFRWWKAAGDA